MRSASPRSLLSSGSRATIKLGIVARRGQQIGMHGKIGDMEFGQAALALAEQLARAAQAQIFLGDDKAVVGLAHGLEPRLRGLAQRPVIDQQAARFRRAAPDASAQLVQLRQAETLGMLDDHDGGFRHIDADFDHRGGDEDVEFRRL